MKVCVVCSEREQVNGRLCGECYESMLASIRQSHIELIAWAAKRARKFERARKAAQEGGDV